ncbi:SAM-dependent methyltransferase [Longimycelium tulufanense]|uniref:SAM-dependent methyltransferase n=1 Tax=Longimycelium tulufanense TaxID=907463 RepID=A0A8J3CEH7_9PSEU|nr:methyltransferase [Longimycelium tulufanense]GGM54830.1 SAM-dependent methyltransferase [Longimycelium tulufanense]
MLPELTDERCDRLRDAFETTGYDADGVLKLLGPAAHAALGRGEPEPVRRVTRDAGALGTLIRMFLLGDVEPESAVRAALVPLDLDDAVSAGLLADAEGGLRAKLDVRPYGDDRGSWWVVSDQDAELRRGPGAERGAPLPSEHVLGIGQASLSLVRATPRRPVGTLLDLGTGCGVQALHATRHAHRVTATDVSQRALTLAAATFRLNRLDVELRRGEWFTPVRGRRFDQVVCNPPFVVGPPRVEYVYRDSGLAGDYASALVVRQLPAFLTDGGSGHMLASWLHVRGQDWAERVASWLPPGVDAWFVQRDVADPAHYVGTWLRDAGVDPRSPLGTEESARWLDWFDANDVEGIGFGFVTLRYHGATDSDVVCEDLRHAYDDPLGPEAAAWLDRVSWLRLHPGPDDLLAARLAVPPSVVLEEVSDPSPEGWAPVVRRLHRTDGPGWQQEVDELAKALLAGCNGALPVGDLLTLLSAAYDQPADALAAAAVPAVRELVRHGMLVPAEWLERA